MIDLGLTKDVSETSFQEATLDDVLSKTTDVIIGNKNLDDIKDNYKKNNKRDMNSGEVADLAVGKVADVTDKMRRTQKGWTTNTSSIISRAKNSIAQFPVYISMSSIRVNEAHVISKTFERVYANFMQTVLAQNPVIDESEMNNLGFMRQFHTNLREAADVLVNKFYEPIDELDRIMCESVFYETQLSENVHLSFQVVPTVDENIILENARLMNEPLTGFKSLQDDYFREIYIREVTETVDQLWDKSDVLRYIKNELKDPNYDTVEKVKEAILDGVEFKVLGKRDKNGDQEITALKYRKGPSGEDQFYTGKVKVSEDTNDKKDKPEIDKAVDTPKLLPADIKKLNGMLPYSIEATFRVRSSGGSQRDIKFIIGIKTVLHPISYTDLKEDLRGLIMGNVKSLQKVRYKTGEITRMEYMFNTKQLKADASKHIGNKRWINTLKRLSEYQQQNGSWLKKPIEGLVTKGAAPIPNGTLVLSQADVGNLVSDTGIDLNNISNVRRLARSLFLIAVVVVDGVAGTMKVFFPDSDVDWDIQSIGALESEISKVDNAKIASEFNKIVNRGAM